MYNKNKNKYKRYILKNITAFSWCFLALRDSDTLTDSQGKYLEYLQLDFFINFIHCATSSSEKQQPGLEGARSQEPKDSGRAVSEKGTGRKGQRSSAETWAIRARGKLSECSRRKAGAGWP